MSDESDSQQIEHLALYRNGIERIHHEWPGFFIRRRDRLQPHPLVGEAAEKITESILEDLLTNVLDWPLTSFNAQIEYADIVLAHLGIKQLIIEAKRPGSLSWSRPAVNKALDQAARYASEQRVKCIAICDGTMFYAADLENGGIKDRVLVSLAEETAPAELWWVSSCGIYRPRILIENGLQRLLSEEPAVAKSSVSGAQDGEVLLHPKYKLPARCFAYVPDASKPHSWKLPYLQCDGTVDAKRLPKAIQAILTNYRGARVSGIPESAVPSVLERLAVAATRAGHMPPSCATPAAIYRQLADVLEQLEIVIQPQ